MLKQLFLKKPDFVCPYCYEEVYKKDLLYVCNNSKCRKIIEPNGYNKRPEKCDNVDCTINNKLDRVCHKCQNAFIIEDNGIKKMGGIGYRKIPDELLLDAIPYFPFSIVGGVGSGKTNYITVMLDNLTNIKKLPRYVKPLNNDARDEQSRNKKLIYDNNKSPEATEAGKKPVPQIWQITKRKEISIIEDLETPSSFTFTIYDGAGENGVDQTDPNIIGYIRLSKAIIITLDPLGLNNVRNKLNAKDIENSERDYGNRKHAATVLNEIIKLIKKDQEYGTKIHTPTAIVLTKFDIIYKNPNFLNDLGKFNNESETLFYENKVDIAQIESASNEINRFLVTYKENDFLTLVSTFTNHMFFGVSSYGAPPLAKQGTRLDKILPHRVCDPILWLLYKNNLISGYKG